MKLDRTAARALTAVVAMLLLSGCYSADLDAVVSEEGTMSGTLFVGVAVTSPEGNGESNGEPIFDESLTTTMFPGAKVESVIQEGYLGQLVTFADAPLTYFDSQAIQNALGSRITITRDAEEFVVDGVQDLTFITPSTGDGIPDPRVELSLTFPGKVVESNGTVDGKTVTWDESDTEMTARAGASAVLPYTLIGAGVGAVLLVVLAIFVLVSRRRARNNDAEPAETTEESEATKTKAKKLPTRRASKKKAPAPVVLVRREIIEPPADWWLDTPPPRDRRESIAAHGGSSDPNDPGLPDEFDEEAAEPRAFADVTEGDVAQFSQESWNLLDDLYEPSGKKKRRGR